jgi:cysteinyl-tRNA synthetase
VEGFVHRAVERVGALEDGAVAGADLPAGFVAAMDDDLNVSAALAVVHESVRTGNTALAEGDDDEVRRAATDVRAMLDVLGLDPLASPWSQASGGTVGGRATTALAALVESVLDRRAQARRSRDWARADALRDELASAGVVVEDSPAGARWSLKG